MQQALKCQLEKRLMAEYNMTIFIILLHDVQDIEGRNGFLECKYRAILHGSTDCTAATVKGGRINGGKLINSLIYFVV